MICVADRRVAAARDETRAFASIFVRGGAFESWRMTTSTFSEFASYTLITMANFSLRFYKIMLSILQKSYIFYSIGWM